MFLAYSGVRYAAGSKKQHTEHERMQFWGTTEHERGALHARHTAKTHTEHESMQFWVPMNTRGGHTVDSNV